MFAKTPATPGKDYDTTDIDGLLGSMPISDEVEVDSDLDDPELLQQLQALSSGNDFSEMTLGTKAHKQNPVANDLGKLRATAERESADDDDDIQVEFTDADANDPHLLNELSALLKTSPEDNARVEKFNIPMHDDGEAKSQRRPNELTNQPTSSRVSQEHIKTSLIAHDNDVDNANYPLDKPCSPDQHGDAGTKKPLLDQHMGAEPLTPTSEDLEETSTDPEDLQRKAAEYKGLALQAKKQGDKKKAVDLLRKSKYFTQLAHAHQDRTKDLIPPVSAPEQPAVPEKQARAPSPPPSSSPSIGTSDNLPQVPSISYTASTEKQQQILQRIISLQKAYKNAALHYKNIRNVNAAKQMLKTAKELLQTGIQVKEGTADLERAAASLPAMPDMTLGDGKIRKITPVVPGKQTFDQIKEQLTHQTDMCHNLAIQNNTKRDAFVKLEEMFQSDLIALSSLRDQAASVPPLHYEQVTYLYKNMHEHISPNGMELKILRGKGVQSLDVSANVEPYVTWDFNGWPPETTKQASLNKGETPVCKGTDPEFNFTVMIPITRTNRAFLRHVQRKKLILEVWHNKYNFGFFRSPILLGKILIPLELLVKKASIGGTFHLVDANRKKTGGTLDIQLNLREPLSGQDIVEHTERWVVLDGIGNTSQWLANADLTSTPYQPSPHTAGAGASNVEAMSPDTPAKSSKPQDPTKSTTSELVPSELEAAEEELNSVDNLVSNMVLEHEINILNSTPTSKTEPDMMDRKQELELKLNMLVVQVQTGMLDMDTYLSGLEQRMDRDRQLALLLKKYNRLDQAKIALKRKKIMQEELREAREAMAAQQDEE